MKTIALKKPGLNIAQFGVTELKKEELSNTNGGGPIALSGAAAVLAGGAMVAGAFLLGVAIGVGIYYGVKWLTS